MSLETSHCPFCSKVFDSIQIKKHIGIQHLGLKQEEYDNHEYSKNRSNPEQRLETKAESFGNPSKSVYLSDDHKKSKGSDDLKPEQKIVTKDESYSDIKNSVEINDKSSIETQTFNNYIPNSKAYGGLCELCGDTFDKNSPEPHECDEEKLCELCGNSFPSKKLLQAHDCDAKMDFIENVLCEGCGTTVQSSLLLKSHVCELLPEVKIKTEIKEEIVCEPEMDLALKQIEDATNCKVRAFECKECPKAFTTKRARWQHVRQFHKGIKFSCEHCTENFPKPVYLKKHVLQKHPTTTAENLLLKANSSVKCATQFMKFQCDNCGKGFDKRMRLNIHTSNRKCVKIGPPKKYKCDHCGQGFNKKGNLSCHMRGGTSCKACGKKLNTLDGLKWHFRTNSDCKIFVDRVKNQVLNSESTDINATEAIVPTKPKSQNYKVKIETKHEDINESGSRILQQNFSNPVCLSGFMKFRCDNCGKGFGKRKSLKVHTNLKKCIEIGPPKKYKCEHCGKGFTRKRNLDCHMQGGTSCKACGKKFQSLHGIHWHFRTNSDCKIKVKNEVSASQQSTTEALVSSKPTIENEKVLIKTDIKQEENNFNFSLVFQVARLDKNEPKMNESTKRFHCEQCEKTFSFKVTLKTHIKVAHLGFRFSCKMCSKSFRCPKGMKAHVKRDHSNIQLDFENCENVQQIEDETLISQATNSSEKSKKSKTYPCDQCKKSFRKPKHLYQHCKIVHKETTFSCSKCSKTFEAKHFHLSHVRACQSDTIINCEDCKRPFNSKNALRYHLKAIHGKNFALVTQIQNNKPELISKPEKNSTKQNETDTKSEEFENEKVLSEKLANQNTAKRNTLTTMEEQVINMYKNIEVSNTAKEIMPDTTLNHNSSGSAMKSSDVKLFHDTNKSQMNENSEENIPIGTFLTTSKLRSLKEYYALQQVQSQSEIKDIADRLDLPRNVVRIWFQNQNSSKKVK